MVEFVGAKSICMSSAPMAISNSTKQTVSAWAIATRREVHPSPVHGKLPPPLVSSWLQMVSPTNSAVMTTSVSAFGYKRLQSTLISSVHEDATQTAKRF
jgi:hypothetical protein